MEEKDKIKLFISYAHEDKDKAAFHEFEKFIIKADQLSPYIYTWTDIEIPLGSDWDKKIKENLEKADIVILVISQAFLNSKYIKTESGIAFERAKDDNCLVFPLFFEKCGVKGYDFLVKQGYPSSNKFICEFSGSKRITLFTNFQEKILTEAQNIIEKRRKNKVDRNPSQLEKTEVEKPNQDSVISERANQPKRHQTDCKFVAIIIVNYLYENMQGKNIPNIKSNLDSLKKIFTIDFKIPEENIIVLENNTSSELNEKLGGLTRNRPKDVTLFVYYSGHGIPDSEDFYWATRNTKFEEDNPNMINTGSAFEASKIKRFLDKSPALNKILVCDCCYAEEFLKGKQFINIEGYMQQKVELSSNTFYLFSSEAKMESFYPVKEPGKATYFTDAFVKAFEEELKEGKSEITIGNIYDKTVSLINEVRSGENPIPTPIKQPNNHTLDHIELFKNPNKLSKSATTSKARRAASTTDNNEITTLEDAIEKQRSVFVQEAEQAATPEELNKVLDKSLKLDVYLKQQEETKSIADPTTRSNKKIELAKANPEMFHINKFIAKTFLSNLGPSAEKNKND